MKAKAKAKKPATPPQNQFYTINEAAEYLRVSRQTVYRIIYRRELSFTKFGATILIYKASLESYLKQNTVIAGFGGAI